MIALTARTVDTTPNGDTRIRATPPPPFILALENDGHRSACNSYMMALMALLAYEHQPRVENLLDTLARGQHPEGHLHFTDTSPQALLVRRVPMGMGYDRRFFRVLYEPSTGTQGFFFACAEHAVLVLRGTEPPLTDLNDLERDLTGVRYRYPYASTQATEQLERDYARLLGHSPLGLALLLDRGIRAEALILDHSSYGVHLGFLLAFESVRRQIDEVVREYLDGGRKTIFIAGHSLGGAIATHAAAYLRHQFGSRARTRLYTFGQPRVGDNAWSATYHGKFQYVRFRNNYDLVPCVPISRPNQPPDAPYYAHFGKLVRLRHSAEQLRIESHPPAVEAYDDAYCRMAEELYFAADGEMTLSQLRRLSRQLIEGEVPLGPLFDLLDHGMGNYLERIRAEAILSCEDWYWDRTPPRTRAPFLSHRRLNADGEPVDWITDSHVGMFLAHNGREIRTR